MTEPESPSATPADPIQPSPGMQISLFDFSGESFVSIEQCGIADEDESMICFPLADVEALITALREIQKRAAG